MADNFAVGYRRDRVPKVSELSRLASQREPDSISRNWRRGNSNTAQGRNVTNASGQLARKLARLGRQNYAPSGGTGIRGVWSAVTADYVSQNIVFFTPDGGAAGTYYALQDVPAGIAPDTGYPYWAAFPFPPAGTWA